MARDDPPDARLRLAAVLARRPPAPAADDAPTVPIPAPAPAAAARRVPARAPAADLVVPGAEAVPRAQASRPPPGRIAAALHRWTPEAWRGARVDPGHTGARVLALVAAAGAVLAAVGVWSERPRAEQVTALPAVVVGGAGPTTETPAPTSAAPAVLTVSVVGQVAQPGLVEVPDGSRVADVLEAAGGALPGADTTGVNLARRVVDGEQVAVGVPPAPDALPGPAAPAGPGPQPGGRGGPVDLNRATLAELDTLPGVGPVTAQRIVEWRERHGRFTRVEQLREVEGIGERRFAQLRELVTV